MKTFKAPMQMLERDPIRQKPAPRWQRDAFFLLLGIVLCQAWIMFREGMLP